MMPVSGAQKKRAVAKLQPSETVTSATSNKRSRKHAAAEPDPVQDPDEEEEEAVLEEDEADATSNEDKVLIEQNICKSVITILDEAQYMVGCLTKPFTPPSRSLPLAPFASSCRRGTDLLPSAHSKTEFFLSLHLKTNCCSP